MNTNELPQLLPKSQINELLDKVKQGNCYKDDSRT